MSETLALYDALPESVQSDLFLVLFWCEHYAPQAEQDATERLVDYFAQSAPSPAQVAEQMAALVNGDTEDRHMQGDALLCATLRALGYGDAVDEFERWTKWYA